MALYALLDWDTLEKYGVSVEEFCKSAKGLKAKILQYRDKQATLEEKTKRVQQIRKHWKKTLIINDSPELLCYCDGLHIGQEDLQRLSKQYFVEKNELIYRIKNGMWDVSSGVFELKDESINPKKIVGLSTHNETEILEANSFELDYIGLGAYRKTGTKDTDNILGKKVINLIKLSKHPVAVIGGVKIYDKIPSKFKVIGSDICRLTSSRLKKRKIFKKR